MHALGLFRERPAHLRRLSGVAKVSLDNRFTRRVVVSPSPPLPVHLRRRGGSCGLRWQDELAQLVHGMNMEVIMELRRETARDAPQPLGVGASLQVAHEYSGVVPRASMG